MAQSPIQASNATLIANTITLSDRVCVIANTAGTPDFATITVANFLQKVCLALPNTDPHSNGALWKNAGVLTVSAG
jgi:hypothetical protein